MQNINNYLEVSCQLFIEILQIEETSHSPLCKWQRQSANSVRAKERDDGRFFYLCLRVTR